MDTAMPEVIELSEGVEQIGGEVTREESESVGAQREEEHAKRESEAETQEVVAMHANDAPARTLESAQCESQREELLWSEKGNWGGEARERAHGQGKAEVLDNMCANSAERVVSSDEGDVSDELFPSVSLAFMKACLASPSEVKFCNTHVPSNYRVARQSEQWEYSEAAMNSN